MVLTLYGVEPSPQVRAVRMACKAMEIKYVFKAVDVVSGDLKTPEMMKMNPEGNVPFIVDENYVLCDSHAIVTYLADKFGNDRWYPKDIKQRKNIQQLLQFNNTMLNMRLKDIMAPLVHENVLVIPPEKMRGLQESLTLMESLIHDEGWLAGSHPTIADCCCAANVSCCVGIFPELKMPPKVASWLWRCAKELPGYDELSTFNIKEILAEVAQRLG